MDRRNFLKSVLAAATLLPLRGMSSGGHVPRRLLGRTGEKVSIVGIGGYHLGLPQVTEEESIRIVRTAIDGGITFLDNCWDYNGGTSEIRMGKALRDGYRERVFLMTNLMDATRAWPLNN
jgi:predicted aldo/keto reductase-like oxidoreductase